jgi:cytochrome c551/c552
MKSLGLGLETFAQKYKLGSISINTLIREEVSNNIQFWSPVILQPIEELKAGELQLMHDVVH